MDTWKLFQLNLYCVGRLHNFTMHIPKFEEFCSMQTLLEKYNIMPIYEPFRMLESMFTELILEEKQWLESSVFRGGDRQKYIDNIKKLLEC